MMLVDTQPIARTHRAEIGSRLVLGLGRSGPALHQAATLTEYFQRMGWNVTTSQDNAEVARESHKMAEGFVVLQVDQGGLLSAAKLKLTRPNVRIVLLGCRSPEQIRDAEFIGAIPMVDASGLMDPAFTLTA